MSNDNKTHPLMWEIKDPASGNVSTIFGTYSRLTKVDVDTLTYKITHCDAFKNAEIHITQVPPPKEKKHRLFSRKHADRFDPVDTALYKAAANAEKETAALNTKAYARKQNAKILAHTLIKPRNVSLGGLLFMCTPIGIPVLGTAYYYEKKADRRNHRESIYGYRHQDLTLVSERLHNDHKLHEKYNIEQTNKQWVNKGYDGKKDTPTKAGLGELLKQSNAFITVGAHHLFGENGLIQMLREKGFICTPSFDWQKVKVPQEYFNTEETHSAEEGPSTRVA